MKLKDLFYKFKYENGKNYTRFLFFKFIEQAFIVPPPIKTCKRIKVNKKAKFILSQYNVGHIGRCSYTQPDLYCHSRKTTIGSFCSIGPRVVLGHGEHPVSYLSASPYFYFKELGYMDFTKVPKHQEFWEVKPIHIGNDVWIGDGVFVKNGVTIGDGAVIGARAVVTKDVPPYAIVVGQPAKILKYRFPQEIIDELLELKWWDFDDDIIRQIPYDNINETIKYLRGFKTNR